jgi:hypothetical protein
MTTWVKRGFQLPADRLTLSATSVSAHIYPNWHHAMEEEFAALITNNTWDLVPCPIG